MFFDQLSDLQKKIERSNTSVVVLPDDVDLVIKDALILKPESRATITIDQIRGALAQLTTKQTSSRFVIIRPADKMGEEAENAILKNLEEPKNNVHFVLVTKMPSKLLTTILSRAALYIWRGVLVSTNEVKASEKDKNLAKRLLVATSKELPVLADELAVKKDGTREYVLSVLSVAIEMAYKSYFMTNKQVFLNKLPNLLKAYDNISRNGHIKLHLVADLI
ncbi:hypothetical protein IKF23_01895 [Candidatus Saccharibacteria bacterium]|nr:hypothetical protein [Candidatus Saccharibacteria bacterium]